jgi:hypothetical protein
MVLELLSKITRAPTACTHATGAVVVPLANWQLQGMRTLKFLKAICYGGSTSTSVPSLLGSN